MHMVLFILKKNTQCDMVVLATSVQVSGGVNPQVVLTIRREGVEAPVAEVSPTALPLVYQGIHGGVLSLPYLDPGEYLVELKIVDLAVEQQAVRLFALQVMGTG